MPLDYLNSLYKLAIDRERAERKRREEEAKAKEEEEKKRKIASLQKVRDNYVDINMPDGRGESTPSMTRSEAEAFEDMLEEGM